MGEILSQFGLGPKPPVQGPMTSPPIAGGMPTVGTPSDADAGEVVMAPPVDAWSPKKPSFLAALGDAYLMSQGMPGGFVKGRNAKNVKEAMRDFATDPVAAIRRLNMIPGMHDEAWDMFNQHQDNDRAKGTLDRQNRLIDLRNDEYIYNQTAGMMGAANEGTWGKMRELALERALARGGNVEALEGIIPKEYDPESIEFIRYGAIKPKDQERLRQHDTTIKNTQEHREARREQIDEAEAGRNERAATAEAGRNARSPRGPQQRDPRYVKTPQGYMQLSPSGNLGRIVKGDKVQTWKKVQSGKWEMVKEEAGK